jgi:hypothetical protein
MRNHASCDCFTLSVHNEPVKDSNTDLRHGGIRHRLLGLGGRANARPCRVLKGDSMRFLLGLLFGLLLGGLLAALLAAQSTGAGRDAGDGGDIDGRRPAPPVPLQ